MRSQFDRELSELNSQLILMGALCETIIARSGKALVDGDMELARSVAEYQNEIEQKEDEIESMCLKLLLRQQPVASDLRTTSAAMKMITDMKRIGVQSGDIAEIILTAHIIASDETLHIAAMARAVIKMVTDSVDAFVRKDIEAAHQVIADDDIVDRLFDKVKEVLTQRFQKGGEMEYALDLLMIAKYFERIGDHAVNIAQWVLYSLTGQKE